MIYLDNAATTQVDGSVLSSYMDISTQLFGNPSSLHKLGEMSSGLLNQSRKQIADLMNVYPEEIYFTSGGTEGDNWAIKGTAFEKESFGKHLITSAIEHPAVLKTMAQLEQMGWDVTYLPINQEGVINPSDLKASIRPDTVLVSIMAVNNEMGSIQPLKAIGDVLKDYPTIHFHVDAVQSVGIMDLDLNHSRIDLAVFSGHKFHAPKGTGFMYIKKGRKIQPLLSGGGQEKGGRSGTENVPGNAAMAKALRLALENTEEKKQHLSHLKDQLVNYLTGFDKVSLFSPKGSSPHIICFGMKQIKGEVVVHALEKEGIYVSTTSACSSKRKEQTHSIMGMGYAKEDAETVVRISLGYQNNLNDIEAFKQAFAPIYQQLASIYTDHTLGN
ncbi:cysteine desulfurase family protein [Alkalibacterium sp. MB6]|uniref:cysteine desulfurase family protein n=1 Tax=Alkalibacterium sp. MB6 TaxID=2081965 RepID=UPI00137A4B41|nr:cysteine desulfurase family protein [Alkalibacterium sp. MB6]